MSVYSGPEPPSGGVRRPPLALIAPHWTQFDGFTSTVHRAVAVGGAGLVDLRRAHVHPQVGEVARHLPLDPDVVRLVVARPVPGEEDGRELVERELAVGRRVAGRAVGPDQRALGVRLDRVVLRRQVALRHGHRARERAAHEEPLVEDLAHVPDLVQILHHVAAAQLLVVGLERADAARRLAALERPERRLRRHDPGLDRVVDPLQRRHVDEARALAGEQQARRMEPLRQRVEAALGDRLRAPGDPLAVRGGSCGRACAS